MPRLVDAFVAAALAERRLEPLLDLLGVVARRGPRRLQQVALALVPPHPPALLQQIRRQRRVGVCTRAAFRLGGRRHRWRGLGARRAQGLLLGRQPFGRVDDHRLLGLAVPLA
eukprot:6996579-Prymnesium_polylepis.2